MSANNNSVAIDSTVVSRAWDHLSGIGIEMTHKEVKEMLECTFKMNPCAESENNPN